MYHIVFDDNEIYGVYTCGYYAECACRFIKAKDIPSPNLTIRKVEMNTVEGIDIEIISKLIQNKP